MAKRALCCSLILPFSERWCFFK